MEKETISIPVEITGVDEAIQKLERYVELLKEAKTLAEELASKELTITTKI